MLIFDNFLKRDDAEKAAADVKQTFGLNAIVCDSQEESNKHDIFPFALKPPILLVDRSVRNDEIDIDEEAEVVLTVAMHGGEFAGT